MSEFNFGSLATTQATSNIQQRLKPWDIYPVKFAGARIETINGRKDPNATYTILKVRFEGAPTRCRRRSRRQSWR